MRLQQFRDESIGFKHALAGVFGQALDKPSGFIYVGGLVQLVFRAGIKVVGPVRRRGVHRSGALLSSHVVGEHAQNLSIEKRMGEGGILQLASGETRDFGSSDQATLFDGLPGQGIGHDIDLATMLQRHIFQFGMKGHGHGGRQSPGSGGPDNGVDLFVGERGIDFGGVAGQAVFHPHAGAGVHCIFNFRFSQRSLVMDAPVHRTQSFIDSALFHEVEQQAHDHRFVLRIHGGVRAVPAAKDA